MSLSEIHYFYAYYFFPTKQQHMQPHFQLVLVQLVVLHFLCQQILYLDSAADNEFHVGAG